MYGLASYIRSKGQEPRLVALLPQQETLDSYQHQVGLISCLPCALCLCKLGCRLVAMQELVPPWRLV